MDVFELSSSIFYVKVISIFLIYLVSRIFDLGEEL